MRWLLIIGILLYTQAAVFAQQPFEGRPSVEVKGLAADSVFVKINGKLAHIKQGRVKDSIKLLRTDKNGAWLSWKGEDFYLRLNKVSGTKYQKPEKKVARFAQGYGGHFRVPGRINGIAVEFLVDTGATYVGMNLTTAKRLGLNYRSGKQGWTHTANGRVPVFRLMLDSVSVGDIKINNVMGSVRLQEGRDTILLGNSYLKRLNMSQNGGLLILTEK